MAARGLVNGRGPLRRSGRDLVFEIAVLLAFQWQALFFQPGKEIVDTGAADGHLEG